MTKQGYIEIRDNEIIFVYHKLGKPKKEDFFEHEWYLDELEEYEASKRSAKVDNIIHNEHEPLYEIEYFNGPYLFTKEDLHNQSCEAEITDNKAIITKII